MRHYTMKKLAAVCDISAGNTAPQDIAFFKNGSFPFFRTRDIGKIHLGTIYKSQDLINARAAKSMRLFPKGTILFPKSGASASLNHRVKMGVGGYVVSHLATIKANNDYLTDDFLLYYLMTIDAKSLLKNNSYPSLNISDLSELTIPIPSLSVQKRIAERLDKVQELIAKQKEQITKLDLLIKSRFIDMFGDPIINSKNLKTVKLDTVADINPRYVGRGDFSNVSFVPMEAVSEQGRLITSYIKTFAEVYKGFTPFREGDILWAKITPCMQNGKGCIVRNLKNGVGFGSTEFHVIRANPEFVNVQFLFFILHSATFRQRAALFMTGSAGQKRVPSTYLSSWNVILPPIDLQSQFANFVKSVEQQKEVFSSRLSHLETLYKSLMQEYFG